MKTAKRFLCIALTLALALALFVPAATAGDIDPNAPVIIAQIDASGFPIVVQAGSTLKLEVQVQLPEGAQQGTLSYAWYDYDWQEGDTTPPVAVTSGEKAELPTSTDMLFNTNRDAVNSGGLGVLVKYKYCVVVTNTWYDDNQAQQQAFIKSEAAEVVVLPDLATQLSITWNSITENGPAFAVIAFPYVTFMSATTFLMGRFILWAYNLFVYTYENIII